jgi:hypothetical protein
MVLGRPIRNLYLRLREKCVRIKNMGYSVKQTMQTAAQHIDEVAGYSVAVGTGSAPVWLTQVEGYLQIILALIGIAVGYATYQTQRTKKKVLEKQLEKD